MRWKWVLSTGGNERFLSYSTVKNPRLNYKSNHINLHRYIRSVGSSKNLFIWNVVIHKVSMWIQVVNKLPNLKSYRLGSYTPAMCVQSCLSCNKTGTTSIRCSFQRTVVQRRNCPTERYACYLHEPERGATVIRIAPASSMGSVSTTCADTYSSEKGLLTELLVQLLRIKPSGLFQFRNNHWTINYLDICYDSSEEASAHRKASA